MQVAAEYQDDQRRAGHGDSGADREGRVMLDTGYLPTLRHDFPDFDLSAMWTSSGLAVCATRRIGVWAEGLYVIVTTDPDELRRELGAA